MARKPPKFEALVVNAIRRMQAAQGSTETEIANYLSQEYDVAGPEVRKHIQLTLKRGMNYGILHKSKRGYVTCDRNIPEVHDVSDCSHRRGSRRRGRSSRRKSSRRAHSRSRKRKSKRASCSSCPRRRAVGGGMGVKSRVKRLRTRRVVHRAAPDKSKAKKTNSSEETPTTRQQANSRSSSKSPMRGKDEDNNHQQ